MNDDPELDGTDFAHPAWIRGQEYGVRGAAMRIQDVLDGKDKGEGICASDKLEKVRQNILILLKEIQLLEQVNNHLKGVLSCVREVDRIYAEDDWKLQQREYNDAINRLEDGLGLTPDEFFKDKYGI